MVRGLDLFRERFRDYRDAYVIIGGTACSIAMEGAGLDFRATKDIDIVLCVEALTPAFFRAFWAFVDEGGYAHRQKRTDKNILYRFSDPADKTFPYMIELFSRMPDIPGFEPSGNLIPIPAGEESSSLSAILLDTEYYDFLHRGISIADGLPVARPEFLIPLKAKAWLDLSRRKENGEEIDSRDIKKHLRDIPALFRIVSPAARMDLPENIANDLALFLERSSPQSDSIAALSERIESFYRLL